MADERPDYSITGRGIEFILTFKNRATKALREAGSQMEQLAKGAASYLKQATDSSQRATEGLSKLQKEGDKSAGYVTAFGMSSKTPGLMRQAWEAVTKLGGAILDKLRRQRQEEVSVTEALAAQTRQNEKLDEAQQGVDKSAGSMLERFAKLAAEAYVVKQAFDYMLHAATEAMELNREIGRINIGRTPDVTKLGEVGPRNQRDQQTLMALMQQTRASREEAMEAFRVLANLNVELDKTGTVMAKSALEFGSFTALGASAIIPLQRQLRATFRIPDEEMPDFVNSLNEYVVQLKNVGVGSYSEVLDRMQELAPTAFKVAQSIGEAANLSATETRKLAMNIITNGSAAAGILQEIGVSAQNIPHMLKMMTNLAKPEMQKFLGFIAGASGQKAEEIQEAFLKRGDLMPFMKALAMASKNSYGELIGLYMNQLQEFFPTIEDATEAIVNLGAHADDIVKKQYAAQKALQEVHPGDWTKRWDEYSKLQGEIYKQALAFYEVIKLTIGSGILDTLSGILSTFNAIIKQFPVIDAQTGELTRVGKALYFIGQVLGGLMIPIGVVFGAATLSRMALFVTQAQSLGKALKILSGVEAAGGILRWVAKIPLLGKVIQGITLQLMTLFGALSVGNWAAIGAALLNPWLLIPAAIIAVTALVVIYRKEIGEALEGAKMAAEQLGVALKEAWETSYIHSWIDTVRDALGGIAKWIDDHTPKWLQDWWQRGEAAKRASTTGVQQAPGNVGASWGDAPKPENALGAESASKPENALDAFAKHGQNAGLLPAWLNGLLGDQRAASMRDHIDRLTKSGYSRDQAVQFAAKTFTTQQLSPPTAEATPSPESTVDTTQQISDIIAAQVAQKSSPTPADTSTQRSIMSNILSGGSERPVRVDNREVVGAVADQTAQTTKLLEQIRNALTSQPDENTGNMRKLRY